MRKNWMKFMKKNFLRVLAVVLTMAMLFATLLTAPTVAFAEEAPKDTAASENTVKEYTDSEQLTKHTIRNPSGITYGYATLDLLLYALSINKTKGFPNCPLTRFAFSYPHGGRNF